MRAAARHGFAVLALWAGAAVADRLELLGPSGYISPDGFEVAVRRVDDQGHSQLAADARLSSDGAEIVKLPASFTVTPRAGVRQLKLRAESGGKSIEAQYPVGPPSSRISLKLLGTTPVKNRDAAVELAVDVLGADGRPDPQSAPPVLRANVGAIEGLNQVGPGQYRARYQLPITRYPEVAVVVAFSAWPHPQSVHGAFGALRVPLASTVELPGQTERDADFSIVIAGQTFGPVKAGSDGRFKVPVIVPPGYATGVGTAIDRLGNRRVTTIDLQLPPTDQLSCVLNPTRLPADGVSRARVLCATSDPFGNVATGAKVQLAANRGAISSPRALENGVVEWTYVAPRELLEKPDALAASWKQGKVNSHEDLELSVVQGPAVQAKVVVDEQVVHLGGRAALSFEITDALGRPRPGSRVTVDAPVGKVGAPAERAPGKVGIDWLAPIDGEPGKAPISARAWGPPGTEPARLIDWAEGGALFAAVTDLAGLPVPGQGLRVGTEVLTTDAEGVAKIGPLTDGDFELRHADWPGLATTVHVRDGGRWVFPSAPRPGSPPRTLELITAPATPVNVRVEARGASVTWWAESPSGELLPERALTASVSSGVLGPVEVRDGRSHAVVTGLAAAATVSVVDLATQVIGLAEVRP